MSVCNLDTIILKLLFHYLKKHQDFCEFLGFLCSHSHLQNSFWFWIIFLSSNPEREISYLSLFPYQTKKQKQKCSQKVLCGCVSVHKHKMYIIVLQSPASLHRAAYPSPTSHPISSTHSPIQFKSTASHLSPCLRFIQLTHTSQYLPLRV